MHLGDTDTAIQDWRALERQSYNPVISANTVTPVSYYGSVDAEDQYQGQAMRQYQTYYNAEKAKSKDNLIKVAGIALAAILLLGK